jgi:hypothetical protein
MSAVPADALAARAAAPPAAAELAAESSSLLQLAARARADEARAEADGLASDASARAVVAAALRLAAALAEPSASPMPRCTHAADAGELPAGEHDEADGWDASHPSMMLTPRRPRSRRARAERSASPLAALLSLSMPPSPAATRARERPRRACARCGVVKTPQWRSGPAGSKSLCNACGTRHRKTGDATPLRAPDTPPPLTGADMA